MLISVAFNVAFISASRSLWTITKAANVEKAVIFFRLKAINCHILRGVRPD